MKDQSEITMMPSVIKWIALLILVGFSSLGLASPTRNVANNESRYLAFQIFTYYSPNPKEAQLLSSGSPDQLTPGTAALRKYVEDIKTRIGTVGNAQTKLAVILGPLCFDQTDEESVLFVKRAFELALQTNVAVGFHIDDSIFWGRRKDLWSDSKNVESLDWDGTPSKGRRLDWSKTPTEAPPQMCFNSKAIQSEVRKRSALLGRAIRDGMTLLNKRKRPELFAGVIAGWETMIGLDFDTCQYLGYRAMLNRGFTRIHAPKNLDLERESVVNEFIGLWTQGIAAAGVPAEKIYSHTAFLSMRAFTGGNDDHITYMKHEKEMSYSQQNHFAPPSVAFGKNHRPGYSTYPQPGLFDDIYVQLAQHKQLGWASSEGTNMQPESGPGQTGMNMETYLAKMFNHGATVVNIFAWGIGGEAMKTMNFRLVTEGEEALVAYRKFLIGAPLIEAKTLTTSYMERLPSKIHKIQAELPGWIQRTGKQAIMEPLMLKLDAAIKAKDFDLAEVTADSILKMISKEKPR